VKFVEDGRGQGIHGGSSFERGLPGERFEELELGRRKVKTDESQSIEEKRMAWVGRKRERVCC